MLRLMRYPWTSSSEACVMIGKRSEWFLCLTIYRPSSFSQGDFAASRVSSRSAQSRTVTTLTAMAALLQPWKMVFAQVLAGLNNRAKGRLDQGVVDYLPLRAEGGPSLVES